MELIGLTISPFSDRAKWALDHHRLPYRYSEHLLIFGIPELRLKLRNFTGGVTVPALIDGSRRLMDSFDIAEYADGRGAGSKLFPAGFREKIREWNEVSEEICDDGRAVVSENVRRDPQAQRVLMPPTLPAWMRRAASTLTSLATSYLNRSFAMTAQPRPVREARLHGNLGRIRTALGRGGGKYLHGDTLTYADVTIACALQMIRPATGSFLDKHEATRRCWTQPALAAEFSDILAWRDQLVAAHKPRTSSRTR